MSGYTKLSSSLVTSTVWRESAATRVVWITMLALANQHGEVEASIPGLADAARVSIPECEAALHVFLSPDKYSRTTDFDGRRIAAIEGGWQLLNHKKYRHLYSADERREHTAERTRRWRERHRDAGVTPCDARDGKQKQIQKQKQVLQQLRPAVEVFDTAWSAYPRRPNNSRAAARKAWDARIREGVAADAILDGVRKYATYVRDSGTEPRFVKMASTFFGPGRHWESDYTVSEKVDSDLQALADQAKPEAYANAEAVRAFLASQASESAPKQISPFGTRSGLETTLAANGGASS